jgi:putative oxidoreductase
MNLRWQFLDRWHDVGLLLLRAGVGAIFLGIHGYPLLTEGRVGWIRTGFAIKCVGLDSGYMWWGIAAMLSLMLGGACLILGLLHRPAAFCLAVTMGIAALWRYQVDATLESAAYPLTMMIVCISLFILGPGKKSLAKQ